MHASAAARGGVNALAISLQVLAAATASLGAASPLQLGAAWYIGKTVASMLSLQLVLAAVSSTNVTASLAIGAASPLPPIRAPGTPLCESVRTRAAAASHAAFKKACTLAAAACIIMQRAPGLPPAGAPGGPQSSRVNQALDRREYTYIFFRTS